MKVLTQIKWKNILAVVAGVAVAGSVWAATDDMSREAILERIKPVAKVRLAGEETQTASAGNEAQGTRSGEQVFNQACAACHMSGVLGAPKKGNAADWEPRIAQGMDVLLEHSINGFNAMPPRGTCMNCSDEEIQVAIEYMIEGI
ncbi:MULTISPECIES: cytochrome c5 family protein [Gammaproteobacteria]|uniref:c-type cytochrome n=1 Tax=Gammaproteobacteria TaxID=1236 RepID=UPI001A9FFD28|nr:MULTISPECIES: cytochrome c5 family protein [Gammaproteobacteria]